MKSATTLNAVVLTLACSTVTAVPLKRASQCADWTSEQWDAIVVGAGTAGIIVADRLSEAGKKTLLLEQGGKSYGITGGTAGPAWLNGTGLSRVDVPGLYKSIFSDSSDLICGDRSAAYGGCTVGGTSAINAGLYFEPPASDWDLFHPSGWKSVDVKPAIQKLYQRQPFVDTTSQDGQFYLQSGYEAAKQWLVGNAGYADVVLNNVADSKTKVFGRPNYNYKNGQRGGPATTYLQTALSRPNFGLQTNVTVKRVIRSSSQATGVLAVINNTEVTIPLAQNGRVVLSGGAIFSPALLMYSGIGSPDVLANLATGGILDPTLSSTSWLNNTAVGAGLFDNPNTFIELQGPSLQSYTQSYADPVAQDKDLYLSQRSGPYSFASQTSVFFTTQAHNDTAPSGLQGTIDSSGYGDWAGAKDVITLNVYGTSGLLSRGQVVLNSSTFKPGTSDNLYYSDPQNRDADDIATFIHDIFQYLPGSGLTPQNIPQNATKDEIKTYITTKSPYAVGSVSHFSSSCKIGTCVGADTRVVGMDNLHVVDASILEPLSVNPQFGIMVAGERGSELILQSWS